MTIKRYWFQNLQTDEEFVTSAYNLKHLAEKTRIPKKDIRLLKTYHRKKADPNDLILLY